MRNDRRAAASRWKPRKRPPVMVIPERETPGARAAAWHRPITAASRRRNSSASRSPGQAVGHQQDEPEHDQQHRDEPDLAQVVADGRLQQRPDGGRGQGRQGQQPRLPLVGLRHPPRSQRGPRGPGQPDQVVPEVGRRPHERAQVQGHVERAVEVGVGLAGQLRPPEEPRDEDQVPAGRDGEELRQPLDDPEHDGVQDGDGVWRGGAEHDRPDASGLRVDRPARPVNGRSGRR